MLWSDLCGRARRGTPSALAAPDCARRCSISSNSGFPQTQNGNVRLWMRVRSRQQRTQLERVTGMRPQRLHVLPACAAIRWCGGCAAANSRQACCRWGGRARRCAHAEPGCGHGGGARRWAALLLPRHDHAPPDRRIAAARERPMEVDVAQLDVGALGGIDAQEALVGGRGRHQRTVGKVEGAAVVRVALQGREGVAAARRVMIRLKAELLERLVNARTEDLPVIGGKAAHHVECVSMKQPDRMVRADRHPQVPHLARVVKRRSGEHMW
mmetsp:Transcript_5873/g.18534  ORF Transcript_5873/g.18534 Transcript_5873/m.18534 type:complete len:269 (-) Transcript_5873:597-1403(-)